MTRKKSLPKWKQLQFKGWKTYNDGMNNRMFSDYSTAKANGYPFLGFAPKDQTTHFTYKERYGNLK